ncbi:MAG: ankyrin repeat domain-containing protein, partial [Oricola sp.]|nr:ankyrin repeat domain-containing protein [Oricola sp.]
QGPAELVELLMRNGALFWQADDKGLRPYDYALNSEPADRDRILFLCADGPKIEDPVFRSAVGAVQRGDISDLKRLLDAHPRLLHDRAIEPEMGPRGYFSDPKLFWFIANNPSLIPEAPANIIEIAEEMMARGVEQSDLDYTLGLVMTNGLMAKAQQLALVETLTGAGAKTDAHGVLMTLGHGQTAPVVWLLDHALLPLSAPIAAALGKAEEARRLLADASLETKNEALAMAAINGQKEAARLALEAGANPDALMVCHSHSTPLHQAALHGDLDLIRLLLNHGARTDIQDTMWRGTPLGWALHGKQAEAAAMLRDAAKS